jgi:hypothetical protein
MTDFPGAVKVHCANSGAWIGAMDFVQACFPACGTILCRLAFLHMANFVQACFLAYG